MFDTVFFGFAGATALCLALAFLQADYDLRAVACILAAMWLLTNLADILTRGDGKFFPLLDGLCSVALTLVWVREPRLWLFLVAWIFSCMELRHAAYFQGGDFGSAARYRYDLDLNLGFAAQIAVVVIAALAGNHRIWRICGAVLALFGIATTAQAAPDGRLWLLAHRTYDGDALAYFNQLATNGCATPTPAFKSAVNAYVVAERSAGNWGFQDQAYIFATADSCTAGTNLAQPPLYKITWNGTCSFSLQGLNGDGATCYGDTNVQMSALVNLSQNNAHIEGYNAGLITSGNDVGLLNTGGSLLLQNFNPNRVSRLTSAASITDTAAGAAGLAAADRTNSTTITTWINGTVLSNAVSSTSAASTAADVIVCRVNASMCGNGIRLLMAGVGQALPNEAQHYTNARTMLLALGVTGI